MNQSASLDNRWWLQFQPSFHNKMNLSCEHLNGSKPGAADVVLQSNCTDCSGVECVQRGFGWDRLPSSTHSKLTEYSNVETASPNPIGMLNPLKVNKDGSVLKAVEETTANDIDGASDADISQDCQEVDWKTNKFVDKAELEGSVNYYMHNTTSKSYEKGGIKWRRADQRELASIVSVKAAEHLQNCDLPPPQLVWLGGEPFKSYDRYKEVGIAKPLDRDVSTSLARNGLSHFEDTGLHSLQVNGHSPLSSVILLTNELSTAHHSLSADYQKRTISKSSSDGGNEAAEINYNYKLELLKALQHSQTRAREAEKTAALVSFEKEQLLSLFLREASHLFAYQQWLRLLEIENAQLRSQLKVFQSRDWDDQSFCSCKTLRKEKNFLRQDQYFFVDCQDKQAKEAETSHSWMSNSFSLAVTLGLSLASAGLIIGWSMGWILPTS